MALIAILAVVFLVRTVEIDYQSCDLSSSISKDERQNKSTFDSCLNSESNMASCFEYTLDLKCPYREVPFTLNLR